MAAKKEQCGLQIETLGNFQVCRGTRVLTAATGRAYRLWELFKYLLTNREKGVHAEALADTLWPDQDYRDAKGVVRTAVYGLRQLINSGNGEDKDNYITYKRGCYQWNTEADYWLDAQEFEKLSRQARDTLTEDPLKAIILLKRVLSLYKGEYLPEEAFSEWVLSQRYYYRRLYLEGVVILVSLLKGEGRYGEILDHCEEAIRIEPFEEELHIPLLEALLNMGRVEQALTHYQYITAALYQELGIKPSRPMRLLYDLLQSHKESAVADGPQSPAGLGDPGMEDGAFFCDPYTFRSIYKLEHRRAERKGLDVALGVISLTSAEVVSLSEMVKAMGHLQKVLLACLRRGDVITRWNDTRFLLLLDTINSHQAEKVFRRIESSFWGTWGPKDRLQLQSRLQTFMPV